LLRRQRHEEEEEVPRVPRPTMTDLGASQRAMTAVPHVWRGDATRYGRGGRAQPTLPRKQEAKRRAHRRQRVGMA
jgi:hypothetical protein